MAEARSAALAGKRIVVTRSKEQAGELVRALRDRGAEVLMLPVVSFAAPENSAALDAELRRLGEFDATLFLSANAVRYVLGRCRELGVAFAEGAKRRLIAAVGPATARALAAEGVRCDYVAREHSGEALARELKDSLAGRRVFLPRSDRGNEAVTRALREAGALVTEAVAYRTALPKEIDGAIADRIRRGEADAMIFASPSAVQNFAAIFGAEDTKRLARQIQFAAIGPTTASALRGAGLPVAIEAEEASAEGLADAIARFYEAEEETVKESRGRAQ